MQNGLCGAPSRRPNTHQDRGFPLPGNAAGEGCVPGKRPRDSRNLLRLRNSRLLALTLDAWTLCSQPKADRDESKVAGLEGDVSILPPQRPVLSQRNGADGLNSLAIRKPLQAKLVAPGKHTLSLSLPGAPLQRSWAKCWYGAPSGGHSGQWQKQLWV